MAVDIFLKVDGIKGESQDKTYKDAIDILSWSWGMSQSGTFHTGGGGGAGKVAVQDLSFTHYVDKATPDLMTHCASGKHIPNAVLVVRKAGDKPLEYLKITMTEIIVSSVHSGGSHGEDRLTESVSLNFAKVKTEYAVQTKDGGKGPTGEMTWNIATNSKD